MSKWSLTADEQKSFDRVSAIEDEIDSLAEEISVEMQRWLRGEEKDGIVKVKGLAEKIESLENEMGELA